MKETYIRLRCSEQEKSMISAMAEQNGMNMSEYILNLIHSEKKYYHDVEVFAVAKGTNKSKTEVIEKGRKSLGIILVDEQNRASVEVYKKLIKEADNLFGEMAKRPNHHFYLEAEGERVEYPFPMSDWVVFGKKKGQ